MKKTKSEKILCSVLAITMTAGVAAVACLNSNTVSVNAQSGIGLERVQTELSATSAGANFVRKKLDVLPAEAYVISATIKGSSLSSNYKIGICAGDNDIGQTIDFLLSAGEFASLATLYGTDRRFDLGYRRIITQNVSPTDEIQMTVARKENTFCFLVNGKLMQIRNFECEAGVPGISVANGTVNASNITYTDSMAEVDKIFSQNIAEGYGVGNCYANYSGVTVNGKNSVTFGTEANSKVLEYSRIAFDGKYSGDLEVSFTTCNVNPLASADTGDGSKWPKFALIIYYDDGYEDMLCLGAAKKQDRVETFSNNAIVQWYNHLDFTGDTSFESTIDRTSDINFRILVSNTGYFKAYRIYVNGELFAVRTSTAYGDLRFGFGCEYVSGTVKDFTVKSI